MVGKKHKARRRKASRISSVRRDKRACKRQRGDRLARLERTVNECRACGLRAVSHKPAFGEGSACADVLFIGEGPGKAEDVFGRVWVGPAGKLLRKTLASLQTENYFTYYLANLVCCHPTDELNGANRPPSEEEIAACLPRLIKLVDILDPKKIIALGKVPFKYLKANFPSAVQAYHPSYILRSGGANMKGSIFVQWYRQLQGVLFND